MSQATLAASTGRSTSFCTQSKYVVSAVTITKWNLKPSFDASTFKFAPPAGATKVDFLPRWRIDDAGQLTVEAAIPAAADPVKVAEPAKRSAGIKVADVAELVNKLKNEAKVI